MSIYDRRFVCYLHWLGIDHIQLGFHIHLLSPNIEIHLPFCFIRVGWQGTYTRNSPPFSHRTWGKKYNE